MKKVTELIFLLVLIVSSFNLKAQSNNQILENKDSFISTSQTASIEVEPDLIYLNIILNEIDNKSQSIQDLDKALNNTLKSCNIDMKNQLLLKNLDSNFQKISFKGNKSKLSKNYELLVHSAQKAVEVMQELQKVNISNISIERLELSNIEKYQMQCRINAIKKAQKNAQTLAEALNQKIGKAFYIQEYTIEPRTYYSATKLIINEENIEDSIPDIDFKKIKIETRVEVKFYLN